MDNLISSFMGKEIITVNLDDNAEQIEEIMNSKNLSFLPVVDQEGICFGVISARDIIHYNNIHKNPKTEFAWEICTHKTINISLDESIIKAGELMVENKIHHLLVTENNRIKGIITSLDLIRAQLLNKNIYQKQLKN